MASVKKKKNARAAKKITKKKNGLKNPKLFDTTYSLDMNEEAGCKTAIQIYPLNIVKTNKKFRENPDNYIPLVKKDPYVLFDAPDSVKNNQKLAEMAVRKDVWTARAVSPEIYGLNSFMQETAESDEMKRWGRNKYATSDSDEKIRRVINSILMMEHDAELKMDASSISDEKTRPENIMRPGTGDSSRARSVPGESVRRSSIPLQAAGRKQGYVIRENNEAAEDDEFGKLVEQLSDDIKK